MTKLHSSPAPNRGFILIGLTFAAILVAAMLIRVYWRWKTGKKSADRLFSEYAKKAGLTDREYQLLMDISINAGLKQNDSIFTLASTFDHSAAWMIEDMAVKRGIEKRRQLETELSVLREKLRFPKPSPSSQEAPTPDATLLSSREIPVKKKLYIKGHPQSAGDFEATVIKNTPAELTVEFRMPVEIVFGQSWTCRYYRGAYVAEFNTTVTKCSGRFVVLKHSNNVRLINRRRFLRVPVKTPAYVASFPFQKKSPADSDWPRKKTADAPPPRPTTDHFQPPRFVPATVTELGGPGLRIDTSLDVKVGDRMLVVFKLDTIGTTQTEKVIEDMAEIRHVTKKGNGSSVALEFIDLKDAQINELIRAANEASMGLHKWRQNSSKRDVRHGQTAELLAV